MKGVLPYLITVTLLIAPCDILHARPETPIETVIRFLEASASGDIDSMKLLIAGAFYTSKKNLLEKNKGYPEFLRKYYQDCTFRVFSSDVGSSSVLKNNHPKLFKRHYQKKQQAGKIVTQSDNAIAIIGVTIHFPDGSRQRTKYLLERGDDHAWKIVNRVLTH